MKQLEGNLEATKTAEVVFYRKGDTKSNEGNGRLP